MTSQKPQKCHGSIQYKMDTQESIFAPPPNFAGLSSPYADFDSAKVVILPVPYDSTTEWHSGTREGPQAIINASQYLEMYDMDIGNEIFKIGIHTFPAIQPVLSSPEKMIQRVYRIARDLIQEEKFIVMLGGEHSASLGIIRALKETYGNLCVLQLDAHADLRNEYSGTKYNHACVMRRVLEHCPIIQVGIRSMSSEEKLFLNKHKMHPYYSTTIPFDPTLSDEILDMLSDNIYISIDLDVLDPSIMSAVGTPEPGGMQWNDILNILKLVTSHKSVVGFDLMELCPNQGPASCAFTAAKLAYRLIGYAMLQDTKSQTTQLPTT